MACLAGYGGGGRPLQQERKDIGMALCRGPDTGGERSKARRPVGIGGWGGELGEEELTPTRHDPMALISLTAALAITLLRPASWSRLAAGSVDNYALTAQGWQQILDTSSPS